MQQQLVAIGLDLGMAAQQIERDPARAKELIGSAREKVQGSIGELRQLGRGLHPAILEDRGIDAALSAVVSGSPIPISVHVDPDLDLSTDVAETVYFVANEAIANVLKHAERAGRVGARHQGRPPTSAIIVHDDGVGGVDPSKGTGVAGIRARVNAVDGTFTIDVAGRWPDHARRRDPASRRSTSMTESTHRRSARSSPTTRCCSATASCGCSPTRASTSSPPSATPTRCSTP